MRKRMLRWALAVGLVPLAAIGAFALWPRPDRITQRNCDRIRIGMSRAEVEAILGPPGDYRTGPMEPPPPEFNFMSNDLRVVEAQWEAIWQNRPSDVGEGVDNGQTWQGDSGEIWVWITTKGVQGKDFTPAKKVPQSSFDKLLWRVEHAWRRWFP